MASIERTAYPQFKRNPAVRELVTAFTLSDNELVFVTKHVKSPANGLTLAIMLKAFQRLGYFIPFDEIPSAVVRHVRSTMKLR